MSSVAAVNQSTPKIVSFQEKCDLFNKQCAVLLGLVVPISTMGTNVLLLLFLFSWFLAGELREKVTLIWKNPVAKMAILFFAVFLLGTTYSEASKGEVIHQLEKYAKLLYIPFIIPLMAEEKWRNRVYAAFMGAMALTWVLSILKLNGVLSIDNRFTLACVFKDHIYTNLMMALTCFMAGHYLISATKITQKILFSVMFVATAYFVLFMSQGRIGYVLFLALSVLLFSQRFSLRGLGLGLIGSLLALGMAYQYSEPFQSGLSLALENVSKYQSGEANTSIGARLEFNRETWRLSKQHPWFGFGTGSFQEAYKTHSVDQNLLLSRNPHNEYLNIFFQLGSMGFILWLSFLGVIFWKSFSLPSFEKYFSQGMLISMIIGCMLNSWLMDFTSGYLFVLLIAVTFGAYSVKKGS